MDLNQEVVETPPRAAATVVLVRDNAPGLETFLVRRHGLSDVHAGAHVFPGGKVDRHDLSADSRSLFAQPSTDLPNHLNEADIDPDTAASLYLAAIRETFEESGVLLARDARAEHAMQAMALIRDEGLRFDQALSRLNLQLDASELLPWSRWITPRVPTGTNKRFDTRFFIATLPDGQTALHDNLEATESIWLRPRDALQQYWDGAINLAPPQIMTLAHLSHYPTVATLRAGLRGRLPPLIAPEPFYVEGMRVVCYPGDERHSILVRAMPGPTRLAFRNRRFEPPGGFDDLFSAAPAD
jgi:8-oxo-dGTP pyrophosphatase MutT (NUDIX family)